MSRPGGSPSPSRSRSSSPEPSEDEEPPVSVVRAELVRGHRPVIVSEVPVYVALRDKEGRFFEEKGTSSQVRYKWSRGPLIRPCVFHPHKTSQFRDVTKTYQYYCSKECFLRGWHGLPRNLRGSKPEKDFDEPIADWVEVGDAKAYCPTSSDIDRPLRLEIIPLLKDGRDSRTGGMTLTTGTVIPTPKEARTRRMISNGGTFNAEWLSQQFKAMNWNILADLYATESMYPYCEKWALSWNWRKHLILKELKSMAADIITLQEVQKDAYDEWFRPQLLECGYDGVYQQKKREPIFHNGKYTIEGCATFFKTTRFKRVEKHVVDYDKISLQELKNGSGDDSKASSLGRELGPQGAEKALQRLTRGNIALAVILEDLHIKTSSASQATGPNGGHVLCVINTHILADPGYTDVKLWQAEMLLRTLETMPIKNMPLLVCGDFNSTPDSAVYELWRQGTVSHNHEDLRVDPCGLLKHLSVGHTLRLATAYETCNGKEAQYTNYTEDFKGSLDYIWFSSDTLAVLAISQVDDESQLQQETALPSSTRPSDHVSLVSTFMFRDAPPVDTSVQAAHPSPSNGAMRQVQPPANGMSNGTQNGMAANGFSNGMGNGMANGMALAGSGVPTNGLPLAGAGGPNPYGQHGGSNGLGGGVAHGGLGGVDSLGALNGGALGYGGGLGGAQNGGMGMPYPNRTYGAPIW